MGLLVTLAIASVMICQFSGRERDGLVAGAGEGLVDGLKHLRRDLVGEDDVGPPKNAAGGDAAERAGKLDRSRGDRALTDANRDGLAGVPLLMLGLHASTRWRAWCR